MSTFLQKIPSQVQILAATKTRSAEEVRQIQRQGISIIGENYVQEAEKRREEFPSVEMHCIGHLQSNKVKKAVQLFDMIQTIDSEKIARAVSKECQKIERKMPVLMEVNIADEPSKTGCRPDESSQLAEKIATLPFIELRGIMVMAPKKNPRAYFKKARKLFEKIKANQPTKKINTLSMGMSDSYEIAIEEGSTMVRLGTILFGKRE